MCPMLPGRRHQLRYHCSKGLGAPIVGDWAYGFKGLSAPSSSQLLRADLSQEWWEAYGPTRKNKSMPNAVMRVNSRSSSQHKATIGVGRPSMTAHSESAMSASDSIPPVMLHSRLVVVNQPQQDSVRVASPIPLYMASTMEALGWSVPH